MEKFQTKLSKRKHIQEHDRQLREKYERLDGLQALHRTYEQIGNKTEAKRLRYRIRVLVQEIRYMIG